MILLDAASPRLVHMQVLDLLVEAGNTVLDALADHTHRHVRPRPGFGGACWLVRSSDATSRHEPHTRLLGYTQWATRSDLDAFTAARPGLPSEVDEAVTHRSVDTYRLDAVITAAGEGAMTLESGDPRLTMVVMMEPSAGQQLEINSFNQGDTRDFFATYDGFVATAFHLADGSEGVVEYIQWDSLASHEAAAADPRFWPHLETIGRLCKSEVAMYDVERTVDATTPIPPAGLRE